MYKLFLSIIGLILTIIGLFYIISYLNLLTIGYNFSNYVKYIIKHIECYYAFIGIIIMIIIIYKQRR